MESWDTLQRISFQKKKTQESSRNEQTPQSPKKFLAKFLPANYLLPTNLSKNFHLEKSSFLENSQEAKAKKEKMCHSSFFKKICDRFSGGKYFFIFSFDVRAGGVI